jgi:hypothetical protein
MSRFIDILSLAIVIPARDRPYLHLREARNRTLSSQNPRWKMRAFIPSIQKSKVPQASRAAVVLAIACSTIGYVGPVAADSLHVGTVEVAQAASNDGERCQQLYSIWQRYKANSTNGSGRDIQSQAALQDCRNGRFEAGVAQLEQLLRNDQIPVPQATSSASR